MPKTMSRLLSRWAPLLALTAVLAACGAAVAPDSAATPDPDQEPPARQATCDDSAIRLLDRAVGVHGAIVDDTLHLGGATAPATCTDPTNESLQPGSSLPDGRTAQVQQSQYYLIVIRYTSGNRLYVISRRGDGTSCVVDTNDECVAEVSELPDDFNLGDLPADVARTIPAGRPAPPTPSPPAGGDDTPPVASPPPATGPPGAAGSPQPANGATGVSVDAPLLTWAAVPGAVSYDVHWSGFGEPAQTAGVTTSSTFLSMSARESTHVVGSSPGTRLAPNTTYYWRVDAKSAYTRGCPPSSCAQGDFWSFTTGSAQPAGNPAPGGDDTPPGASPPPAATGGPPGRPSNPQPRDGATGVTVDAPLLSWSAAPGAAHYYVHWYPQKTDWAGVKTTSTFVRATAPESHRVVRGETTRLAGETTYYWRVQAVTAGTTGCPDDSRCTSSKFWSFTTGPAPAAETSPRAIGPPGAASNPQPRDGATGVRIDAPLLGWSAAPGAFSYDVHWATTESAITSGQTTAVNTDSTSVKMTGSLAAETTYYWRVDAKNDIGATPGNVWSFTTGQLEPRPGDRVAGPLAAPAWTAAARRLKIEAVALKATAAISHATIRRSGRWWVVLATLDPPTGNPIPTVTKTGEPPGGTLAFSIDSLEFRRSFYERQTARSGTITLTASNSEGTATLEVPYKITCPTMAAMFERVRGTWVRGTNDYIQRLVINDSNVTATLGTGTEIGPLSIDSFTHPPYAIKQGALWCTLLESGSLGLSFSSDKGPTAPRCNRHIRAWLTDVDEYSEGGLDPAGCD